VDLIDYRSLPDDEFKWVLHYKEHLTKFSYLWPLTAKNAALVTQELLHHFLMYGAPRVLQSDNGCEFVADIISD